MKNNLVLTDVGIKPIGDLVNRKMRVIVGHKTYQTDGFRIDGIDEMFQIDTVEGYSVIVPSDCSLSVSFDGIIFKQKLKNISIGDNVLLVPPSPHCWDSLNDDNLDGYLLGLLIGDGTIYHAGALEYGRLFFHDTDNSIIRYLNNQIPNIPMCRRYDGIYDCWFERIHQLVREFDLDGSKNINDIIKYGGREFLCGFLSGLFDADGSANKNQLLIVFAQTNYKRIKLVQILLSFFGIRSAVISVSRKCNTHNNKIIPGNGSYQLYINNDDAVRFRDFIGFHHDEKKQKLDARIKKKCPYRVCKSGATIASIESIGVQTKYTIDVPAYTSNGIIISQSIKLPDGHFIGVNVKENPATVIIEQVGDWAYGMHKEA